MQRSTDTGKKGWLQEWLWTGNTNNSKTIQVQVQYNFKINPSHSSNKKLSGDIFKCFMRPFKDIEVFDEVTFSSVFQVLVDKLSS